MSTPLTSPTAPIRRPTPIATQQTPSRAAPERIAVPSLRGGSSANPESVAAHPAMGVNPLHTRTDEDDGTVGLQGIEATAGHLSALRAKKAEALANSPMAKNQSVIRRTTPGNPGTKSTTAPEATNNAIPDANAHPATLASQKPPSTPIDRALAAQAAKTPPSGVVRPGTPLVPTAPLQGAGQGKMSAPAPMTRPSAPDAAANRSFEEKEGAHMEPSENEVHREPDHEEEVTPKTVTQDHTGAVPSAAR